MRKKTKAINLHVHDVELEHVEASATHKKTNKISNLSIIINFFFHKNIFYHQCISAQCSDSDSNHKSQDFMISGEFRQWHHANANQTA